MNFSRWHSGTKVRCELCLFSQGKKTPEFTKMGESHELFVLALSLVWLAGATPDHSAFTTRNVLCTEGSVVKRHCGTRSDKFSFTEALS